MVKFKVCRNGCTRTVILIGKYAIKIPCLHYNYPMFIEGIRANLNERQYICFQDRAPIAKTFYANRFGLLNIQERVRPVNNRGLFFTELEVLCSKQHLPRDFYMDDPKPENFGYNSRNVLVKLDYGN